MELIATIAYYFLVRMIFFDFKWLRFNIFWGFVVFGLYAIAVLTEIVFLGQFTPYSKTAYLQAYTIPIAPQFGGIVKNVFIKPNKQVTKGAPLFSMDEQPLMNDLNIAKGRVALAQRKYDDYVKLKKSGAVPTESVTFALDKLNSLKAVLAKKEYNLKNATLVAPSKGYVTGLLLKPGAFVRLKAPVMTFISTNEYWLIATVPQRGSQWIRPGDKAEVSFELYPGQVFNAVVDHVLWATGEAQHLPSGRLPNVSDLKASERYVVKLKVIDNNKKFPLRFGAKGIVAIYTSHAADLLITLRKIEIRMESFLNYLYNPF